MTCSVESCNGQSIARGLCVRHYAEWKRKGEGQGKCERGDCQGNLYARGLCAKHYKRWLAHGDPSVVKVGNLRHGQARARNPSPEYRAYLEMKRRCFKADRPGFEYHGGRGITVYQQWVESPQAFLDYMGPKPEPKRDYSLDRYPNNDGNYEPGNVRWATRKEQMNNTRKQQRKEVQIT